jgi:hypothetical protein
LRLTVELPIEEGELIARALDCAVAAGDVTTDVDPDAVAELKGTAWRAQQADALVAVVRSYLHGGSEGEGGSTADHYQVVVHAEAQSLTGGAGHADLPIDTVKRLLCDGSLVLVAEDADGQPLDVGRKQRTVSTPLRRALYARDRGCTFPGCHRKRYLDGHHLEHWIHGGETSAHNMTLLCTHHHRQLHEGGFRIVRDEGGTLRFVTADGRSIPRNGYRLEDFVDDDVGAEEADPNPSREGFCTTTVQPEWEPSEVRETAAVYRLRRDAGSRLALPLPLRGIQSVQNQQHDERENQQSRGQPMSLRVLERLHVIVDLHGDDACFSRDAAADHEHHPELADRVRESKYGGGNEAGFG